MSELSLILALLLLVAFASTCTVQISGVSTGASCVSWFDCNLTCCTKSEITGCYGTNNHACAYTDVPACVGDICCRWTGDPGACIKRECVAPAGVPHVGLVNCVHCGCVQAGTCDKKACGAIADNNPDVCAGCSTCAGDWDIDNDRGLTPWAITVTGELHVNTGGHIVVSGHRLNAGSIRTKPHLLHVRPGTGGNIHVT